MRAETIILVGLNHESAPVEIRERLSFEEAELRPSLERLKAQAPVAEAAVLSTCNRVEVIAVSREPERAKAEIQRFLLGGRGEEAASWARHFYVHAGREAIKHLFRVGASLDSMVVGEPQILGQLKRCYSAARDARTVGATLHRLFHRAFSVAKRIRTETGIGVGSISVSAVAVELARRIFDRLEDKTVMLIGAGKIGELLIRHLQQSGARGLIIANRTFARAVELAAQFRGNPVRFEEIGRYLRLADVIIGCAAAPHFVLGPEIVTEALKQRKQRAMFLIDLAVPRNFDPRIDHIDNAYLYNIDDLRAVAAENLLERGNEARKAEAIVEEETEAFLRWLETLERVPVIVALRQRFEEIRQRELEKSLASSLKDFSERERQALEDMTNAMINKILHAPTAYLKQAESPEDGLYAEVLRKLFDLDED